MNAPAPKTPDMGQLSASGALGDSVAPTQAMGNIPPQAMGMTSLKQQEMPLGNGNIEDTVKIGSMDSLLVGKMNSENCMGGSLIEPLKNAFGQLTTAEAKGEQFELKLTDNIQVPNVQSELQVQPKGLGKG